MGKFTAYGGAQLRRAFRRPELIEPGHQGISERRWNRHLQRRAAGCRTTRGPL